MNNNQTIARNILLECGIDEVDDPKLHRLITEALTVQKQTLHQELQKARESWLREEVVKLKDRQLGWLGKEEDGSDRHPNYDEIQTIIDRYQSELDQPNK